MKKKMKIIFFYKLNDLIKRDKYINDLHNKLSNYDKDYNNLINYIIEKFSNIEELIENYDINNLTNLNFQKEDDKIFSKYDLINKNFQNLIKRLKEIRINDKEKIKKYEEIIKKEKEKNFQLEIKLSEEKTERITERKNILGIDEVIKENSNDIQRLNNTITNIINKTDEYEFEKNNLFKQLIQFKQIINNLCDENIQILFDYINHNFKKDNFNFPFSTLPNYSYDNEPEIKLKKINESYKILLSYLNNLNNMNQNNFDNNKVKILKNSNNNIYKINEENISKNMENKFNEISELLIESNKNLVKNQIENSELLKKNTELESLFNNDFEFTKFNSNSLNYYNNKIQYLKNELQIKDFQIQTLEKLIKLINKNNVEPYIGKIISNKKMNELNNLNNKKPFTENEKNERELNILLNKFYNKKISINQKENTISNYIEGEKPNFN